MSDKIIPPEQEATGEKSQGGNRGVKSRKGWRIALAGVAAAVFFVLWSAFGPNVKASEDGVAVYVPTGTTPQGLEELLHPHLRNRVLLGAMVKMAVKAKGDVHAGKFLLHNGQGLYGVVKTFFVGRGEQVAVRFNGLASLEQLAGTVARQIEADSLSLLSAFRDKRALDSLGTDSLGAMGFFVPDTYYFYWDTSAGEFFRRMLAEHEKFWKGSRREKAEEMGLTPLQVVTLASIVQAETARTDERAQVAGLYVNRLKQGIPLQSDPTVIYAMRLAGHTDTIRRVYFKNLKMESPFNTYRNRGLPPAPINIPDVSSVEAVLNYGKHGYLYMCASVDKPGYHAFAATMEEHGKNRRKYVAWLNERGIK